jgi:DNA-binding transcriptional ArsR family regulator
MDDINVLVQFYKALADETRLRLIQLLAGQAPGHARCVSCLANALETTASNVSQHLKALKDLGLVQSSRRGYRIHYVLDHNRVAEYDRLRVELLGKSTTIPIPYEETEETTMCCKQDQDCIHPDRKPKPERRTSSDCTPEQIEECHGKDAKHHCCEEHKT